MNREQKWLFDGPKYKTSGVENYVPEEVQLAIWSFIESRRNQKIPLDYLQVFNLRPIQKEGLTFQLIECQQEVPEYRDVITVVCDKPITDKLYLIDDRSHCTLLRSNEY